MEDLRNLVSGQGCDDGSSSYRNPLARFTDHMYRDKSQREHEEWVRQNIERAKGLNTTHENALSTQAIHKELGGFMDNFANEKLGRVDTFDPLNALDQAEIQEVDSFMNRGISLNPKIKQKLHIPIDAPPDLVREFISNMASPPDLYADQLANEFHSIHLNEPLPFEEMDKLYRQAEEHNRLVQEYEHFQSQHNLEQYYDEANEAERWAQEFHGERPTEPISSLKDVTRSISSIPDPKLQNSNFFKFLNQINNDEVELVDNQVIHKTPDIVEAEQWADEFKKGVDLAANQLDHENWANEFEQSYGNPSMYNQSWLNEFEDFDSQWVNEWSSMNHLKDYEFTNPEENPYTSHPEPFKKGLELFNDGRLAQAILAFEAELLQDPSNSKCWEMLGKAHAENDKDSKAISALLKSVDADPHNLDALSSLAVSYTNDLYRDQALDILKQWVERHPDYQHLRIPNEDFMGNFDLHHKAVTELFIEAARLKPDDPDPDVQTALGLLFNLNLDYEKAVDCFKAALSVRPDDYLLWNKLGATLANSNRSDEAIGCYFNALQIKPSYVRARANLGISFMALQDYDKAATYFLQALTMHPKAKHIWSNLNMVFLSMGREDLVQRSIENGETDVECFRDVFDF